MSNAEALAQLPDPQERWAERGRELAHQATKNAWAIGDWVNEGRERHGKKYKDAVAITDLSYGTLRNYASVAGKFTNVSRRRDKLTFQHHAEVASIEDEVAQDAYLDQAEEQLLRVKQLRELVKPEKVHTESKCTVDVTVPAARSDRAKWSKVAKGAGMKLDAWIRATLNDCADRELAASKQGEVEA